MLSYVRSPRGVLWQVKGLSPRKGITMISAMKKKINRMIDETLQEINEFHHDLELITDEEIDAAFEDIQSNAKVKEIPAFRHVVIERSQS